MSGRESMWVVYFKFGIVSKNSLRSFMVFLILSGCEQWNHYDQQALTPERWRSSEGPIWPTLGHSLIHILNEAHPHCTPYSMQTTCVCVCLRSHFQEVHEEANYCGFLLQFGIREPDCTVMFSTGSLWHCRHISDLKIDQSCHQHGELSPGVCMSV